MLPHAEIAPLVRRHCVALASDCDDAEPEVEALAAQLEDATMLPFVLFVGADGRVRQGFSGAVNPLKFKRALEALFGAA